MKFGCFDETHVQRFGGFENETEIAASVYFVATSEKYCMRLVDVYQLANDAGLGLTFGRSMMHQSWPFGLGITQDSLWKEAVAVISAEQPEVASRALPRDSLQYHSGDLSGKRRCFGTCGSMQDRMEQSDTVLCLGTARARGGQCAGTATSSVVG